VKLSTTVDFKSTQAYNPSPSRRGLFSAGIFSCTGTRKSPLNMFRLRELRLAHSSNSCDAGGCDGVPFGIFPAISKGWSGMEPSLTCRQGDFAEDLSDEGMQTQASRQVDKQMPPSTGCIQNAGPLKKPPPRKPDFALAVIRFRFFAFWTAPYRAPIEPALPGPVQAESHLRAAS